MDQSQRTKQSWEKSKQDTQQAGEYTLEETKQTLLQRAYYQTLKGKAKNRTLIKENKKLYNSIYKHTEHLEDAFKKQGSYKVNYSFYYRILFIVEHNVALENLKCKCNQKYTWTTYCRHCPDCKKHQLGKPHTALTKLKMRKSTLEYLKKTKGQVVPRYNRESIAVIEQYGTEHGYVFMHAENGGEYFVKELGYFVDAYDPINNTVLEFDEKHHFNNSGELRERDKERQKQIQDLLKCEFIRIKYDHSI